MALLDDVLSTLVTAGVVDDSSWYGFKSYMPPTPDQSIAVFETPGEDPDQSDGTAYDLPGFQVRIRGEKFEYDVARTKAEAVFSALNNATISGYVYVFAATSAPLPMGYDKSDRPELSWNFRCMKARS